MHENLRNTEDRRQSVFEVALRVAIDGIRLAHAAFPLPVPGAFGHLGISRRDASQHPTGLPRARQPRSDGNQNAAAVDRRALNASLVLERSVPHCAIRSTESTVRQLNEPKINHFEKLGCNLIGRKTARNNSAWMSCSKEPLKRAGICLSIALRQPSAKRGQ